MLPNRFARRERNVVGAAFMTPVSPTDSPGGNRIAPRNGRDKSGPYDVQHSQINSPNSINCRKRKSTIECHKGGGSHPLTRECPLLRVPFKGHYRRKRENSTS